MSVAAAARGEDWRGLLLAAQRELDAGEDDKALATLGAALRRAPREAAIYRQLGVILHRQKRYEAALACFRRARDEEPNSAVQHANLGIALRDLDRFAEAAEAAAEACRLAPDDPKHHFRRGYALLKAQRPAEAVPVLERAAALDPANNETALTLALALLASGDLQRGWPAYEARFGHKHSVREAFKERRWDGRRLDGTLLVTAEQGLGDALQFVRYVPLAAARCRRLVLQCQSGDEDLFRSVAGVAAVVARNEAPKSFEAAIPLMSLPRVFGTTLETIPADVPYVRVDEARRRRMAALLQPLAARRKVGIVWGGNPRHQEDARRSLPFRHVLELLAAPNVALVSLQKGVRRQEMTQSGAAALVQDMTPHIATLGDNAAAIEQLDLLVACDTGLAHLAGALGKPVWILLASSCDWRWMSGREDSPWYPTARLFRQARPGDWEEVFGRVVAALARLR